MKQQLEKIQALLVRGVYPAAEYELEQLIADCEKNQQKHDNLSRLGGLLYVENKELKKERDALLAECESIKEQSKLAAEKTAFETLPDDYEIGDY